MAPSNDGSLRQLRHGAAPDRALGFIEINLSDAGYSPGADGGWIIFGDVNGRCREGAEGM